MNVKLGIFDRSAGASLSFELLDPEPKMRYSTSSRFWSAYIGRSSGRANGVTPPIIMPVNSRVSSGEAKEARETLINPLTVLFTSKRSVPSTTQAENCFGPRRGPHDDGIGAVGKGVAVLFTELGRIGEVRVYADDFVGNAQPIQGCDYV